jgi:hypothetical protein
MRSVEAVAVYHRASHGLPHYCSWKLKRTSGNFMINKSTTKFGNGNKKIRQFMAELECRELTEPPFFA